MIVSDTAVNKNITVQLPEAHRHVTDVLRELMIPTPNGEMIPLSTLASVEYSGSIGDIVRINNERVVTVNPTFAF